MRRNEFLKALSSALRALKDDERERYIANYTELIDDKLETGMSEEQAIAELGDPTVVAGTIIADAREQGVLKEKRSPLTVALLILGSPVWIAILAALFSVLLALYTVIWAIIICACAVEFSLAVVFLASIIYFAANFAVNMPFSLFVLGLGLVCAAAAAALYKPIKGLIVNLAKVSANIAKKISRKFKSKGRATV